MHPFKKMILSLCFKPQVIIPPPVVHYITITNVTTLSVVNNLRQIKIYFDTNFVLPTSFILELFDLSNFALPITFQNVTENFVIAEVQYEGAGIIVPGPILWIINLTKDGVYSNTVNINDPIIVPSPPANPSGGSTVGFSNMTDNQAFVTYEDGFGNTQNIYVYTENGDCVTFYARQIIYSVGCTQCL